MLWANARIAILCVLSFPIPHVYAKDMTCRTYSDGKGNSVKLHPRSFADRSYCPGYACSARPHLLKRLENSPDAALGPPRQTSFTGTGKRQNYTLGCNKSAIWEFTDNLIVDVPGPDLLIFEVGRTEGGRAERTRVEISDDGSKWIDVGITTGGTSGVDIAGPNVLPKQTFRFIKLTDLGDICDKKYPGADIDAIATYGYAWKQTQDDTSMIFFEQLSANLTPSAKISLDGIFAGSVGLDQYSLDIVGHTDSDHEHTDNQLLSKKRADAVRYYFASRGLMSLGRMTAEGRAATQPLVRPEVTASDKAKNRRVEMTFLPPAPCPP